MLDTTKTLIAGIIVVTAFVGAHLVIAHGAAQVSKRHASELDAWPQSKDFAVVVKSACCEQLSEESALAPISAKTDLWHTWCCAPESEVRRELGRVSINAQQFWHKVSQPDFQQASSKTEFWLSLN